MHQASVPSQRRFRKWLGGGVALAMAIFAGSTAANATVFAGSAEFFDITTSNILSVTADPNPKIFSTDNLIAPQDTYFAGFMTLSTQDPTVGIQNDRVALKFSWSQPSTALDTEFNGNVTEATAITFFSFQITGIGTLVWDDSLHWNGFYASQTVHFSNGAIAEVEVYDTLLTGSSSALAAQFDVRIRDIKDAPEPASIALLGAGLLGMGLVRRRRQG